MNLMFKIYLKSNLILYELFLIYYLYQTLIQTDCILEKLIIK
jgi:hypothetical protein